MKRLKVLVSAYAFNPSGSAQLHPGEDMVGWRLVEQISRFNDVWVITHTYNRKAVCEAISQGALQSVDIHFIKLPLGLRFLYKIEFGQRIYYFLWQILAWKEARKLHSGCHFDVAHHVTFGNDWIPSFIGAFLPVPFIWGPIGGGQQTPKGLLKEFSLFGRTAEAARRLAQWMGRQLFTRRRCAEKARAILVCNNETKAKFQKKHENKIHFFPVNGVSKKDIVIETDNKVNNRTFRVLTAGRMHRLKGFSLAIKSFSAFSRKYPDSEFAIIGTGTEQPCLEQLIQDLDLNSKIQIYPWVPREGLLEKIRLSHVFIFPSFRDGGGAVVVEAMASGKPVICLDTGGPGFHVQEEWGIKVRPEDPEYVVQEMANALEKLYLNQDIRIQMGRAASKRAEEFYLWERLGEKMQQIYEDVLPRKS